MLQLIGLIVAVYAIARLLQTPFELDPQSANYVARLAWLLLVSAAALLLLTLLALSLIFGHVPRSFDTLLS